MLDYFFRMPSAIPRKMRWKRNDNYYDFRGDIKQSVLEGQSPFKQLFKWALPIPDPTLVKEIPQK